MAMLAEPRRKQKFSVDPRNLNWSNDDNRFGKKLMERMGWQQGKGLGANEDGNPDHIKIRLKDNTHGVGCSKDYADNWVAHQDDFNALLSTLNESNSTDEPPKVAVQSLEEKSKSSKGRIHYKKFAKGKDLTNANKEDLNCIFGKRLSKSASSTPQCQSEASSDAEKSDEEADKSKVFTFTSTTSVQDYFKQKLAAMKAKAQGVSLSAPASTNPSDEESRAADVGSREDERELVKKKKKKSKKRSKDSNKDIDNEKGDSDDKDIGDLKSKKSKKKKKRNKECDDVNLEDMKEPSNESPDETDECSKKNKKRNRDRQEEAADCDGDTDNEKGDNDDKDMDELKSKKSKKHKKENKESDDANHEKDIPNESQDDTDKSSKKKKKRRRDREEEKEAEIEHEVPKSKKKKRKDKESSEDMGEELLSDKVDSPTPEKTQDETQKAKKADVFQPNAKQRKQMQIHQNFSKTPSKYFKGSNLENIQGYGS